MSTRPRHDFLPLPVFSLICVNLCHLWIKIPSPHPRSPCLPLNLRIVQKAGSGPVHHRNPEPAVNQSHRVVRDEELCCD